ncbi:MAG TPA: FtsX-like permease family protein [Rhodocyclaceae bacterium]|nr:FtsX-like permease family protein [Rhodocyclaceae bacterium]
MSVALRLAPVFLGALARRRMTTLLSCAAIALGVALGMGVQVIHEAALAEFGRGLRSLAGAADLQVVGPRDGFDEALYGVLAARPEVAAANPLVEVDVRPAGRDETLAVLGVDVFAAAEVAPALMPQADGGAGRLGVLAEDAVFLSAAAAEAWGAGATLTVQAGAATLSLRVAGSVPGVGAGRRLAVMDIAAAQRLFGRLGRLSRIGLRLAEGVSPAQAQRALAPLLPAGVILEVPAAEETRSASLSRSYRVNLALLAAIALLTGGFLVFSAQALSVVRRRREFAFLRALGLSRRSLMAWLVGEGAIIGGVGGVFGVALGLGLAWMAVQALGGDLGAGYFQGVAPRLIVDPLTCAGYAALGVAAGALGAWWPAREAARVAPAQALKAAADEALPGGSGRPWAALTLWCLAAAACLLPPIGALPIGGYGAVAGILAGAILFLPTIARVLSRCLPRPRSVAGRLAVARLVAVPGHVVVAAAGVLTSVALAAAMAIMVTSFRESVDAWLTQLLPADIYVRAGRAGAAGVLDEALQARLAALKGVVDVRFTRHEQLRLDGRGAPVALIARPVSADGAGLPRVGGPRVPSGAPGLWISEAMADLYGWQPGMTVTLPLAGRAVTLPVAGVWRDYARQTGSVLLDLEAYQRFTGDRRVHDAALTLAPGASAPDVVRAVAALAPEGSLEVSRPGEIRAITLGIFDRTFAVTYLLEAVAVLIGLAGVAASFAALAAARRREFGMLRHLGVSRREIAAMLAREGALAAGVGVLGGLLAGGAIALVLIEVVNRQSFHWSMDLHVPWGSLAVFALTLVALAALAAVAAGRQAMRREAVWAVREEG